MHNVEGTSVHSCASAAGRLRKNGREAIPQAGETVQRRPDSRGARRPPVPDTARVQL